MLSKVVDLTLGFKVLNGENWKAKSLFLDKFVAIFSKKYGSFSLFWRICFRQNSFPDILRLKKSFYH